MQNAERQVGIRAGRWWPRRDAEAREEEQPNSYSSSSGGGEEEGSPLCPSTSSAPLSAPIVFGGSRELSLAKKGGSSSTTISSVLRLTTGGLFSFGVANKNNREETPLLSASSSSSVESLELQDSQSQHNSLPLSYGTTSRMNNDRVRSSNQAAALNRRNESFSVAATTPDGGYYRHQRNEETDDEFGDGAGGDLMSQHHAVIALSDETLHIYGYQRSIIKTTVMLVVSVLTLGIVRLILHWNPEWLVKCTANKCPLSVCDHVLVKDDSQNIAFQRVHTINAKNGQQLVLPQGRGKFLQLDRLRYFNYRKLTYFWQPIEMYFANVSQMESNLPLSYFHDCVSSQFGLSTAELRQRLIVYGRNLIEVKLKPIYVLLFKEAITPFYIFQVFSVTVWYNDNYAYFASIIVLMSVVSISLDVFQIRRQERKLRSMVHTHETVQVLRNGGQVQETLSDTLVPGDILLIPPHGCILQCDAIVMTGTVIVNESMLTGESVPITKVALPELDDEIGDAEPLFSFKEHSKHILFCGTQVLQTRFYGGRHVQAVVLRTAYSTLKGQLVRSIMYPKPVDFRFTKDLFKFVGFLSCIAGLGFMYTIAVMIYRGSSLRKIILRSLDIITIVVPPALPAAMSIGIFAAQMRLRAKQIFCISPSTINTCGAINTVCFDKTGTLTEDGLDFNCLRAVNDSDNGGGDASSLPEFTNEMYEFTADELPKNGELLKAVATCHSLTRIEKVLNGDPLDLILFRKTGWILDEVPENVDETAMFDMLQPTVIRSPPLHSAVESEVELAVIRQFTFSSSLQRMSVIVHNPNEPSHRMHLYCKGAPEMIASLCRPETVPANYQHFIDNYAQHGYRLIAVAKRELDLSYVKAQKVKREQCESDMTMLGLIVMENRLKAQTTGVINQLNRANIRTIMITGDNLLTAMSVARECGIIRPNKRAFLLEASHSLKGRDGRTHLVLKQSVSSSEEVIEEDELSSGNFDVENVSQKAGGGDGGPSSSYHLAISGPTLTVICSEYPEMLEHLICVCDVYARMSPDQKQLLVNKLQEVDYTVAMCGDGANDCAALKAAHAGISLSEAEASIAAPFTSKVSDIRCVPMVIREGRAALVTSFGVFKYMAGYSLTQFITIMQLYWLSTNLTDIQFLYIDLALITLVALFFGYTPACERLARTPPPTRLLSLASMLSIIGQLAIIGFFQLFTFIYTIYQPWFVPYAMPTGDELEDRRSMQGTSIFCVSMFQYLTLAIIYSKGYPYRKPIFSNRPLCLSLAGLALVSIMLTVKPPEVLVRLFEYDPIPYVEDRLFLLVIGLLSGVTSYLFEVLVIQHLILDVRERNIKRRLLITDSSDTLRFERILMRIGGEPQWIRTYTTGSSFSAPNIAKTLPQATAQPPSGFLQPNGSAIVAAPTSTAKKDGSHSDASTPSTTISDDLAPHISAVSASDSAMGGGETANLLDLDTPTTSSQEVIFVHKNQSGKNHTDGNDNSEASTTVLAVGQPSTTPETTEA